VVVADRDVVIFKVLDPPALGEFATLVGRARQEGRAGHPSDDTADDSAHATPVSGSASHRALVDTSPPDFAPTVSVSFPLEAAEWGRASKAAELADPRARWARPALWALPIVVPLPFIVAIVLGAGSVARVISAATPWEIMAL